MQTIFDGLSHFESHKVHLHSQLGVPVFEILSPAFNVKEILIAGVCVSVVPHSGIEVECASSTGNLLNSEHRWVQMMRYSLISIVDRRRITRHIT